jgi:hypothetical protein
MLEGSFFFLTIVMVVVYFTVKVLSSPLIRTGFHALFYGKKIKPQDSEAVSSEDTQKPPMTLYWTI